MKNYSHRSRTLITSGAGFLDSHICERLPNNRHDIICRDNFFTGTKVSIAHCLDHPHFERIRNDVIIPLYVEVDKIYNLACPASTVHYEFDPVQTTKTSVHGAINMLGLAKRTKAKIFQASASEVCGDPQIHPQPESYWGKVSHVGLRSRYEKSRVCGTNPSPSTVTAPDVLALLRGLSDRRLLVTDEQQ